jgi:hypothetical protein
VALILAGCTTAPRAHLTVASAVRALEGAPIAGLAQLPTSLLTGAGAGILSEHGAGVVSNNGAMLVGKSKYGLLATGQKPAIQFKVQVVDAAGAPVLDAAGQPYEAVTGEDGRFSIPRRPLGHNLLLKLALPGEAGALLALLPEDGTREVALEGVGTHVVGYVLDQFVAGKQSALDRPLGPAVDDAIARAEDALAAVAGGKLEVKSLATASVVATVGVWRDLSQDFDRQIRVVQQVVN